MFVGSLNLDPRSIALNTEFGLVVRSPELAAQPVAEVERVLSPELSWRLELADRDIVWVGTAGADPERVDQEPATSW